MALTKGTNSYVNVSEAEAYFADRLDVAAWTSASADQKAQSLVTATMLLDGLPWGGCVVSDSQALAWPRQGSYFDPRKGYVVDMPETVPQTIITATFEVAYHLLNNDGLLDDTGSVKNLQVGSIQLEDIQSPSSIPKHIRRQFAPLLVNGGSASWWRAN